MSAQDRMEGAPNSAAANVALPRPRVDALLAGAWERRVTLVIAGAGYGKTTALRRLIQHGPVRWLGLRPADRAVESLAARLAEILRVVDAAEVAVPTAAIGAEDRRGLAEGQAAVLCESVRRADKRLLLVLDDVDQLEDGDPGVHSGTHLLRALCLQAPAQMHIALSGRSLPALGLGAAAGTGQVLEINAPDLAFTLAETEALVVARLGAGDASVARRCWELTGGWAAALHLVLDRLQRVTAEARQPLLERMPVLTGQVWREFVADLLEREPADERRILEVAALAPIVDLELLAALGVPSPATGLEELRHRGLLMAPDGRIGGALSPVLSEAVLKQLPGTRADALREQVGGWLESEDRLDEALECRLKGPSAELLELLGRRGHELVTRGGGARVADVLASQDSVALSQTGLEGILGEALQALGDWDGAMETFGRLRRTGGDRLSPEIAWRYGALLYLRGDSDTAQDVLSSAHVQGEGTADDALVSAWLSSVQWSRGASEEAGETASVALAQAELGRDSGALAAAHVAAALVAASRGDREHNERHYRAALKFATQAGDSIQLTRIRANLSSKALEEGDYRLAIEESDRALSVGSGHKFFAALAMCNKAEALLRCGELEEARAVLAEAIEAYAALGSLVACAPHTLLGMIYRERGDLARARVSFERAQRMAEQGDDAHTLVFALCGLALTVAEDDPDTARTYAAQAVERSSSLERAHALCTSASVELFAGDRTAAGTIAAAAELEARRTGDRPTLAEVLSLQGIASAPPREDRLSASADLWSELGNVIAQQRVRLVLAVLQGDLRTAEALRRELTARGVAPELGPGAHPGRLEPSNQPLVITTLGRFALTRGGERVLSGEWQSRKARDLLKLLVARRGRQVSRDAAAEALWRNEPPGPLSNRLSVALSTLRKVLDPDRSHPPDHFVATDGSSMTLRLEHAAVDVIAFLEAAAEGVAQASDRNWLRAEARLRQAEKLYAGEFLEEDLYEDWAVDCREAARSAALEVSRLLARAACERGDDESASRHLRRLLERDPYDEDAWIALIGAQTRLRRYGEARRQHASYARRMGELAIGPVTLDQTVDVRP